MCFWTWDGIPFGKMDLKVHLVSSAWLLAERQLWVFVWLLMVERLEGEDF